ncbi:MAG: helix-turn-helix transcriptional regulator, partial [Kordiimonadaceae bacterium]|nr:helix-turn-helix transcriptional regulator [Kordiimonadaceae bacterium]
MNTSIKRELVKKALKSYYAGGFQAVGMDRLAKETGISKTSMYKHFRKKEDLILEVLALRDEQFRNWFIRRIEEMANTPI